MPACASQKGRPQEVDPKDNEKGFEQDVPTPIKQKEAETLIVLGAKTSKFVGVDNRSQPARPMTKRPGTGVPSKLATDGGADPEHAGN